MFALHYAALLFPAFMLTATTAILICIERPSLSLRMLALGGLCVLLLPIRMWESVLMIFAAGVVGTATRVLLTWIERTRLRDFASNPYVFTFVGVTQYGVAISVPSSPSSMSSLDASLMESAVSAFHWLTLALLIVIGAPLLIWSLKNGKAKKARFHRERSEFDGGQFTILSLLLCVLAISIGCAASRMAWTRSDYLPSPDYLLVGAMSGAGVALFSWLVRLNHPWLVLQLFLLGTLLLADSVGFWIESPEDAMFGVDFIPWSAVGLVQFLYGAGGLAVAFVLRPLQMRGRLRNPIRVVAVFACFVGFVFTGRLYKHMFRPNMTPVVRQTIKGNRYQELVDLIALFEDSKGTSNLVPLLDQISAITKDEDPIVVPSSDSRCPSGIRSVNRAFVDDAIRLESAGETDAALDRILTLYLLNCRISFGGDNCDLLIRHTHNSFPYQMLIELRQNWKAEDFENVQVRVAQAARYAEPLSVLNRRTKEHAHATDSWFDGIHDYDIANGRFDGLFCCPLRDQEPWEQTAACADEEKVEFDLLITDCAINRFKLEVGRLPHRLEELVPRYIAKVPIDPFSGRPIRYRVLDETYELYSFGRNRVDDFGFGSRFNGDRVIRSIKQEPW